jgi:hypothetical protein
MPKYDWDLSSIDTYPLGAATYAATEALFVELWSSRKVQGPNPLSPGYQSRSPLFDRVPTGRSHIEMR